MSIPSSGSRSLVPGILIIALATKEKEECGFESLVMWEMRVAVQGSGRGPSSMASSGALGEMAGKQFSVVGQKEWHLMFVLKQFPPLDSNYSPFPPNPQ